MTNDSKHPVDMVADHLRAHLSDLPVHVAGRLTADDGTEWVFSPGLDLWTGWMPGEDGVWTMTPDEFAKAYPELRGSEWGGGR